MKFEEETLDRMAKAIFTDGCQEGADYLTLDDFKKQLQRQDGLLKNMGVMINKWLVPARENQVPTGLAKILAEDWMSINFWTNPKRIWILIIFLANLIIMVQRVYYFSSFSMLSGYIPNFFLRDLNGLWEGTPLQLCPPRRACHEELNHSVGALQVL
jgi:hypothetical protein